MAKQKPDKPLNYNRAAKEFQNWMKLPKEKKNKEFDIGV